jgi:tRNA U55 pseudouridine synthase TruB
MSALRRTRCGAFTLADCQPVERLEALAAAGQSLPLLPPAQILPDWPGLPLHPAAWAKLANGIAPGVADIDAAELPAASVPVRLLAGGELAAVGSRRTEPGGRRGDFELWKVFPEALAAAEKLYSPKDMCY